MTLLQRKDALSLFGPLGHKNLSSSSKGRTSLQAYGPTLQRAVVEIPCLDGTMLCSKLRATKLSAPGMDKLGRLRT